MTQELEQIRERAYAADDEFQAECVRQFGAQAGNGRFNSPLHDARTAAARERFHAAKILHADRAEAEKHGLVVCGICNRAKKAKAEGIGELCGACAAKEVL